MKTTNKLSKWCKRTLMLLPAVAILTLAACEKEDTPNPFEGGDNHITSFVLTKGDVSYTAAIAAGTITVTVPENVSLNGATAEVALCENATINPKPADISDWDSEQQFVVTAYNGTKTTYTYTVEHSGIIHTGAVILNTQAEVDAFGQGEYTVIDGTLVIGAASGTDTITSLVPLAGLKTVSGGITVNATYGSEDLTAFEHLETVGDLRILSKKVKTVRFPELATVRLNVDIDQATAIETLDFPELTIIQRSLRIYYADALATLNFPELQRVLENVTIEGRIGNASMPNLQTIAFPDLAVVGGTVKLTYASLAESFSAEKLETAGGIDVSFSNQLSAINLPALKTVNGDLSLTSTTVTTNLQLPDLHTIKGSSTLTLPGLTSLELSSLKKVGGTLSLVDLRNVRTIDVCGIEEIGTLSFGNNTVVYNTITYGSGITLIGNEEFAGKLSFNITGATGWTSNTFPVTVQGIKKVGSLEVGLNLSNSANLYNVNLEWLEEVTELLTVYGFSYLKYIDLPNLKKAGGLFMAGLSRIETLSLPELEKITGYTNAAGVAQGGFSYAVYTSNSSLNTLSLPKLERIAGDLSITETGTNSKLTTISFPELTAITGTLTMTGRTGSFSNLGFDKDKLTSIAGVTISTFTNLKNFEPLKGVIPSLTAATWRITGCGYNPTYQDMVNGNYSN